MEKICKNCRWWEQSIIGKMVCDRADTENKTAIVECGASDDSGLWAYLVTAPTFGCNEFTPRNEEKV